MATGWRELTSDEIPSIKCCVCNEKGLTRDAEKYCVECCKYYCSTCLDMHSLFPALKLHQFLDKSSFWTRASDNDLPCFATERCLTHPGKIVDLYCQDHDEVACASCIAVSHRSCSQILSIPENIHKLYNKEKMASAKQQLKDTNSFMQQIKTDILTKMKKLNESLSEAVESVKSFRKEIDKLLDCMQQTTIKNLQQEFEKIEESFKEKLQEVEMRLAIISDTTSKMRKSAGNEAQEFVCSKISGKTVSDSNEFQMHYKKETTAKRIHFTREDSIETFLKSIKILGAVSYVSFRGKLPNKINTKLYKVKKRKQLNVELPWDIELFNIFGSCITKDGSLLLAEYDNKMLKRVDMSTVTVRDWFNLQAAPRAVCSISTTEAAVTLDNNSVQFVSLGDKLMPSSTLHMNHNCCGLACTEGKLFISDAHSSVYMYNTSGQQLKHISPKDVFSATRHITVTDAGDRVYIADYNKGLVILDSSGNHLSTVTDPAVSGCRGVCTDGRNIFVCNHWSGSIVQIGQDLKVLGEVAKESFPYSLCFDRQRNSMVVTRTCKKVTMLEFEK